ncbi:hypothetical protein ACWEVP_04845 [Amycolatopsis sp. NPDC003865]
MIKGKAVQARSGRTFASQNPYPGEPWAIVPDGSPEDVGGAVRWGEERRWSPLPFQGIAAPPRACDKTPARVHNPGRRRAGLRRRADGPELRSTASAHRGKPTPEQIRKSTEDTVTTQFETISVAAEGCDVLVAGGALQFATRSIAQRLGAAYVHASFCPITLPSDLHAPPPMPWRTPGEKDNRALWEEDARRWNSFFGAKVNEYRAAAGQAPVDDLQRHVVGERPWLAADAALAPWPPSGQPM